MEPDALFQQHSVVEVRTILSRTTADIERKKQDLRVMVGERYRDLIDAADAIRTMHESAASVSETLLDVQRACDSNAWRKEEATKHQRDRKLSTEQRKKVMYGLAAQIKILADTPEQIWHAMECHSFLKASRLYLVSQEVYENLQTVPESWSIKPSSSFPVIKRQWNAVQHFQPQIVERSTRNLLSTSEAHQKVADTLAAIILLTSISQEDALLKFLSMRKIAVIDVMRNPPSDPNSLAAHIRQVLELLRKTLEDVMSIFLPASPSDPSRLTAILTSLVMTSDSHPQNAEGATHVPSAPTSEATPSILNLYSTKTNLHIIYRHLPPAIQCHRPKLKVHPSSASREVIRGNVDTWLHEIGQTVREQLKHCLERVEKGAALAAVWKEVLEFAVQMERGTDGSSNASLTNSAGVVAEPWEKVCRELLAKPYSLWTNLVRETFYACAASVIQHSLETLANQPQQLLKGQLDSLALLNQPDRNIGDYIWGTENQSAGTIDLDNSGTVVYRAETPATAKLCNALERVMREVKDDTAPLLGNALPVAVDEADYYRSRMDKTALVATFRKIFGQTMLRYRDGLLALLHQAEADAKAVSEDSVKQAEAIDTCLFIGRVGRSVALRLRRLESVLEHDSRKISSSVHMDSSDSSALEHKMLDVYTEAHTVWMNLIAERLDATLLQKLKGVDWRNGEVADGREGQPGASPVPVQPSSYVAEVTFDLCQEWNRIAGFTLEKASLQSLMTALNARILALYGKILNPPTSESVDDRIPEGKALLQVAFDLLYFATLFQPSPDQTKTDELRKLLGICLREIHPTSRAETESTLTQNVQSYWTKTSTLFGAFLISHKSTPLTQSAPKRPPLASMPTTDSILSSSSALSADSYNVIPLSDVAPPRFSLLPVPAHLHKKYSTAAVTPLTKPSQTTPTAPSTSHPQTSPTRRVSLIPDTKPVPPLPARPVINAPGTRPHQQHTKLHLERPLPPVPQSRPAAESPDPRTTRQQLFGNASNRSNDSTPTSPSRANTGVLGLVGPGSKTLEVLTSGAGRVLSGVWDYTAQVGSPALGRKGRGGG
ncbi:uncharacterized protein EV422DRAFT_565221 [Fimicolochytrium jonesii]|uniref:uncharacterized protein n=1 Tax=Fimicolochytrium jonesii TaxID=1396493 RepID=UPI0022FE38D3|nr:uncharacterized protein EV422DRAFT_565221 [Fimicolochytrium jonesii]KAI8824530.1 hypothetical protein EV422DRAFT_565221 [Fimicolochytrium jonesii]